MRTIRYALSALLYSTAAFCHMRVKLLATVYQRPPYLLQQFFFSKAQLQGKLTNSQTKNHANRIMQAIQRCGQYVMHFQHCCIAQLRSVT